MKRFISTALALLLVVSLVSVGVAKSNSAGAADQRLAAVTLKVKEQLKIGDEYTEFYGDFRENELAPTWSLTWSNDNEQIDVTATESGKIISYYYYDGTYNNDYYYYAKASMSELKFPVLGIEDNRKSAENFVKPLLDKSETIEVTDNTSPS